MPKFNVRSQSRLNSCHSQLQKLFREVVKDFDCSILCGYRDEVDQNKAYEKGYSKVQFPNSKHNIFPSVAVDVVPYPVDWNDLKRFYYFAGFVKGTAFKLGIKIRWGGDWNGDTIVTDQSFFDLPHHELWIEI